VNYKEGNKYFGNGGTRKDILYVKKFSLHNPLILSAAFTLLLVISVNMFQVVFLKQVVDDSIREGDVVVETNGNEHPRLSFYN